MATFGRAAGVSQSARWQLDSFAHHPPRRRQSFAWQGDGVVASYRLAWLGVVVITGSLFRPGHGMVSGRQAPPQTVLRFLIGSPGAVDQRGFVEEYARSLSGIRFELDRNQRERHPARRDPARRGRPRHQCVRCGLSGVLGKARSDHRALRSTAGHLRAGCGADALRGAGGLGHSFRRPISLATPSASALPAAKGNASRRAFWPLLASTAT